VDIGLQKALADMLQAQNNNPVKSGGFAKREF
jgi:hypothetical protein